MKDTQNEFYSSISEYYHEIFPFNPAQLNFTVKNSGGIAGRNILDIGCATGELASQLAVAGAEVTGIDLNEDLLQQARSEKKRPGLTFRKGDMLKLKDDFKPRQFDTVVCFGNTLVHLPSENHVKIMLENVGHVLKPGGVFLLQILNYDYILDEEITELPVIETENIKFVRKYIFEPGSQRIIFKTELFLKKEENVIANETPLLALRSQALIRLLNAAAFKDIDLYAGFREEQFGGKHLPLVAKAFFTH